MMNRSLSFLIGIIVLVVVVVTTVTPTAHAWMPPSVGRPLSVVKLHGVERRTGPNRADSGVLLDPKQRMYQPHMKAAVTFALVGLLWLTPFINQPALAATGISSKEFLVLVGKIDMIATNQQETQKENQKEIKEIKSMIATNQEETQKEIKEIKSMIATNQEETQKEIKETQKKVDMVEANQQETQKEIKETEKKVDMVEANQRETNSMVRLLDQKIEIKATLVQVVAAGSTSISIAAATIGSKIKEDNIDKTVKKSFDEAKNEAMQAAFVTSVVGVLIVFLVPIMLTSINLPIDSPGMGK